MSETKNGRIFSIIAGILFLLHGCYLIWRILGYYINDSYFSITFLNVLWWCIYIGLGILLLIGKKNAGFLIVLGAASVSAIYCLVRDLISYWPPAYLFKYSVIYIVIDMFDIVIYGLLFIVFLLNVIPGFKKNAGITKFLWFLPAVLIMVKSVIEIINYNYRPELALMIYIVYMVATAEILFMGLWLSSSLPEKEAAANGQKPYLSYQPNGNPYIPYQSQPGGNSYTSYQASPSGNPYVTAQSQQAGNSGKKVQEEVEQLKAYKELLDSGVLTQEEFDAKKKEILGL